MTVLFTVPDGDITRVHKFYTNGDRFGIPWVQTYRNIAQGRAEYEAARDRIKEALGIPEAADQGFNGGEVIRRGSQPHRIEMVTIFLSSSPGSRNIRDPRRTYSVLQAYSSYWGWENKASTISGKPLMMWHEGGEGVRRQD